MSSTLKHARFLSTSLATFLAMGLALPLVTGCQPDKGPGSLTVTYELGNQKLCSEVGVDSVRAELLVDAMVEYSEDVTCADGGAIILENLEPGVYELEVRGYDEAGVATFDNLGTPLGERRVEIFEAADSSKEAELTGRPADLKVRWRLGDMGFGNCGSVGIDRFEIGAYQTGGGVLLLESVLDCELAGDDLGYRNIDDAERVLNGTLFGEVGIQALDASGAEVGDPATFIFDPVGAGYPVELTVECSDLGCTGSGTVDP